MIKRIKNGLILMFGLLIAFQGSAQDLHYSQFYNSPMNLNPAHTGLFNGDHRFNASLRDQWRNVPVPWTTFSAAYDRKFDVAGDKNIVGGGLNFNYDRQGASRLNLSSLNIGGSFSRILTSNHIVTGGILLGVATRGFNTEDLTWDKQWNGDTFNKNDPSGENFDAKRLTFVETGLGLNYRYQRSARTKLDLGVSGFHVIEPKTTFYDTDNKRLPMNITLAAIGSIKLIDPIDLQVQIMRQIQEEYREMVFGGLAKIYLNQKRGKETQIHAGLGYRTSKSFIPTIAIQYTNWYVGFSYDFDNTELNEILNSNRGGPEIHVRYIITNVKPLNDRKVCPIY